MVKIRIITNWNSPSGMKKEWNKLSKGDGVWNNIVTVDDESRDYDIVINKPPYWMKLDLSKVILLQMEPKIFEHPELWGVWSYPEDLNLFLCKDHLSFRNNIEWHLLKTYRELKETKDIKKEYSFTVSTILSNKYSDPGQKLRIDFCRYLENNNFNISIYGSDKNNFKNYKGSLPTHNKENALMPYKYTFNCENNSYNGYFTEKIVDAILCECLCFYWGAPNLESYLGEGSFVRIPLHCSFEESKNIMENAIKNDLWRTNLPKIKEAKRRILDELSFYPTVEKILKEKLNF